MNNHCSLCKTRKCNGCRYDETQSDSYDPKMYNDKSFHEAVKDILQTIRVGENYNMRGLYGEEQEALYQRWRNQL